MRNPYTQVALTYIRRPFSSGKTGFLFVWILLMIPGLLVAGRSGNQQLFGVFHLLPFAFLFGDLVVHVKEQFIDSRAHLTPGFRRTHAVIAGAAALLLAVVFPAAFAWFVGWHPVGFVAITVLLFSATLWMLLSMSGWISWLALIGWTLLIFDPGKDCAQLLVSGKFEYQSMGILAVGVALALLGGTRLVRLNEDMSEYRWIRWNSATGKLETSGPQVVQDPLLQKLKSWLKDSQMASLTRHAQRASVSRWSRVRRWQVGMLSGWSAVLGSVLLLLNCLAVTWIVGNNRVPVIAFLVMFVSIMPVFLVGMALWPRRLLVLPRELLMCVDRPTYLKQVGMAAALKQLQVWVGMAGPLLLWWWWAAQSMSPTTIGYLLATSALLQPALFGATVWILPYRSRIPVLTGCVMASQAVAISAVLAAQSEWASAVRILLFVAAIVAVLGLIATWDAYRRWLTTDFD